MKKTLLIIVLAGAVITLGACTKQSDTNTNSAVNTVTNTQTSVNLPTSTVNETTARIVSMRDDYFSPQTTTVAAGTLVTWKNDGTHEHEIVSDTNIFGSDGDIQIGDTYSYTFLTPGTYPYHCENHDGMTGTVIVQ